MFYKKFSEIKVGFFVLVAVVIVTATLFWSKGFIVNKDKMELKAYFQSIGGLNYGDPVTVNGVHKGKVLSIDLEGDSVLIIFSLEKGIKIKNDYKIEVASPELMSGKTLYISPGKSTQEIDYLKPLTGSAGSDISTVMKKVSDMSGDVKELIGKFGKTADKLDILLGNVNDIVGDPNMKSDMKSTISNLAVVSRNLNGLVTESRANIKNLTSNADKTFTNVNSLLDDTKPDMKNTIRDIQSLTTKFDSLVTNINLIVGDIQQQKSGVGKFIYDDKFFNNLNKTLEEVEKLTKKIRQDGVKINLF